MRVCSRIETLVLVELGGLTPSHPEARWKARLANGNAVAYAPAQPNARTHNGRVTAIERLVKVIQDACPDLLPNPNVRCTHLGLFEGFGGHVYTLDDIFVTD